MYDKPTEATTYPGIMGTGVALLYDVSRVYFEGNTYDMVVVVMVVVLRVEGRGRGREERGILLLIHLGWVGISLGR